MPIEDLLIKKQIHSEIEYARENPCIIRFISNPKPWHREYDMPLTKIWLFFKRMTPWKSEKLKYCYHGIKLSKYFIIHFFDYLRLHKSNSWNADTYLNMEMIIKKIYNQIEENNGKYNHI
jgi:lipopolysaccharide biosynthesis glycosyltransferase